MCLDLAARLRAVLPGQQDTASGGNSESKMLFLDTPCTPTVTLFFGSLDTCVSSCLPCLFLASDTCVGSVYLSADQLEGVNQNGQLERGLVPCLSPSS
jgi:hypothetical protein